MVHVSLVNYGSELKRPRSLYLRHFLRQLITHVVIATDLPFVLPQFYEL